jgi:hypothetical protein
VRRKGLVQLSCALVRDKRFDDSASGSSTPTNTGKVTKALTRDLNPFGTKKSALYKQVAVTSEASAGRNDPMTGNTHQATRAHDSTNRPPGPRPTRELRDVTIRGDLTEGNTTHHRQDPSPEGIARAWRRRTRQRQLLGGASRASRRRHECVPRVLRATHPPGGVARWSPSPNVLAPRAVSAGCRITNSRIEVEERVRCRPN